MHLVCYLHEDYHDARSLEHKIVLMLLYIATKMIYFRRVAKPVMMLLSPDYSRKVQDESCVRVASIAKGNAGQTDGELIHKDSKDIDGIVHATPKTAVNCFRSVPSDTSDKQCHEYHNR